MNIMDVIRPLGAGGTTNAISSLVGLSQDQTQRATTATIPTLLAGLTQVASTPRGAEQLSDTISRQDTGMLDNLPGSVSSQGGKLAEQGQGILTSLMGGGTSSMLGGVLSKFTGINEGATGKLIGICMPLILGVLGRQQKTLGLGPTGLANFLSGQKGNIRAAMPAGLESMLSKVPGFGQFLGSQPAATATATAAAASAAYERPRAQAVESRTAYEHEEEGPSAMRWLTPVLIALALLLGVMWSRHRHRESAGRPAAETETTTGTGTSLVTDGSELLTQATSVLSGIKDHGSAEAAVPKLKSINAGLTRLRSATSQVPDATAARDSLKPSVDRLQIAAQRVLNMPGVGDTIRPYVEQIIANANALTQ